MVLQKRDIAVIAVKCVIFGCCAIAQNAAFGARMAASPTLSDSSYTLLAQSDTPVEPQAILQETKNADAPARPQAEMREIKSTARLSKSKQRRRKPKMAGVPAGSQALALETKAPELQVAGKGTPVPEPQAAVMEAKVPEATVAVQEAKAPETQAVAQAPEETDTLEKPLAEKQEAVNVDVAAKAREDEKNLKVADVSKKKYGMAPIQWGVRLTETLGKNKITETHHGVAGSNVGKRTISDIGFINTQTVDAGAKTYILQPYIAQVDGSLSFVNSRGAINDIAGRSKSASGDASLKLFPQSRFPFSMMAGVGNRTSVTQYNDQETKTDFLTLNQSYRPLGSFAQYRGGYKLTKDTTDLNTTNYLGIAKTREVTTRSGWDGDYSTRNAVHRTNIGVLFNEKLFSSRYNITKRTDHVTLTDIYLPAESLLAVNSYANVERFSESDGSTISYLLANSNISWQPEDEEIPLFVDGNVHLFGQYRSYKGSKSKTQSAGVDARAKYIYSKNLTGYASGSVDVIDNSGRKKLSTTESASAAYLSDVTLLKGGTSYAWNARAGATNRTGSPPDSTIFGGVGHGLGVPYPFDIFGKKMQAVGRINQSLHNEIGRIKGQKTTLDNTGSISVGSALAAGSKDELLGGYGRLQGGISTGAVLSVTDRRVYGREPSHSRVSSLSVYLRETSQTAYTRPGLSMEVTLEATQGTDNQGLRLIGGLNATYVKSNVFNVRGLSYVGSFAVDKRADTRVAEDLNANNPRFPWTLDQRLRYRIGQNELQFRANIADKYGIKNSSLWLVFKAWRTVGNVN